MAGPCSADFERLAQELGNFGCEGQHAVMNLHSPFALDSWSMLVVEAATVIGVVLALRHALHRRRQGDPTVLAIWVAALAYLAVVEPPLYFPESFGLQEQVGLIFVHNEFVVQFLWGRLPLYIVAFYPVMAVLSYELVRVTGVFERRGPFVSALAVGFVYHVFYEFFDHIGPQLQWWIWNADAPTNEPLLASVPISSMVNFAVAGPVALTFLIRVLVARHPRVDDLPTTTLLWRGALAGILMPLGLVLGGLPATLFTFGDEINRSGQEVAYWSMLAIVGAVAIHVLIDAQRAPRVVVRPDAADRRYLATHAAVYLGALVVAWVAALPAYLDAVDGVTAAGTPIGSGAYAATCLVLSLGAVWLALARRPASVPSAAEVSAPEPATLP